MSRNGLTSRADRAAFEHLEDRLLLTAAGQSAAIQLFQASPALFVENQGQWEDAPCECEKVRYAFHGSGANIAFTDAGPIFQVFRQAAAGDRHGLEDSAEPVPLGLDLEGHASSWPFGDDASSWPFGDDASSCPTYADATERIPPNTLTEMRQFSVSFEGANAVSPIGLDMSESYFNYCIGDQSRWRENVPAYQTIAYMGLWDGIDLFCSGRRDRLKYEFHIAPGADYRQIRIRYDGIEGLSLNEAGALQINLGGDWAPLVDDAPLIYQDVPASAGQAGIDGRRTDVAGGFALIDASTCGFAVAGEYDPLIPVVIDPIMAWSTYLGGTGTDVGNSIAVDSSGNVLVAGQTQSSGWTSGGFDTGYNGYYDGFVVKLSPTGGHTWSTYLGGSGDDRGRGIAVDGSGNVLVTGQTRSSGWTSGGFDTAYNGGDPDAFVAKLSPTGGHIWSTYLGGSSNDGGSGIAVDGSGNVLVTGGTNSSGWTSGGFDTTYNGAGDAFVAKLLPTGGHIWSSYLGGSDNDPGYGIAVDGSGNVLVTGSTDSSGWTAGGFDTSYNGPPYDAFVVKLSATSEHMWSTYLGGGGDDRGQGIAVDASGNALVAGSTGSDGWTSGGFDTTHNGGSDAYVAKLSPTGAHIWSTYLGGSEGDWGEGIAVDAADNVVVTGAGYSSGWTSGGFDTSHNGEVDAFVAKLSAAGERIWSTYLGGSASDGGCGVAVDGSGNILVAGRTYSSGWTSEGFDTSYNGGSDAFVAKLLATGAHIWSTYLGGNDNDTGYGIAVDGSGNVLVTGDTCSSGWTAGGFDTSYNGSWDAFVAKISEPPNPPPRVLGMVQNAGWGAYDQLVSVGLALTEWATVDRDDLVLTRDRTGQQVPLVQALFSFDAPTCLAMWNLSGIPIGPGWYTARLVAAGVADREGGLLDGNGDGIGGDDYTVPVVVTYRGDCDVDGDVDFFDYLTVKASFGKAPARWEDGDTDGDADVDFYDYLTVKGNFGQTVGGEADVLPEQGLTAEGAACGQRCPAENAENARDIGHRRQEERPTALAADRALRAPEASLPASQGPHVLTCMDTRGRQGHAGFCGCWAYPAGLPSTFDVDCPPAGEAGSILDIPEVPFGVWRGRRPGRLLDVLSLAELLPLGG